MGWGAYGHWVNSQWALADEGGTCGEKLHGHYKKVLSGLAGTEHRKDWTLEVALHTLRLRYEERLFDFSSRNWSRVQHRVTAMKLNTTFDSLEKSLEKSWVLSWLRSTSDNLRSLTLVSETSAHPLFRYIRFPVLTHLATHSGPISPALFKRFLYNHATTLQSLELGGLSLRSMWLDEDAFAPSDLEETESEDEEEDEEQSESAESRPKPKLVKLRDETWFSVFEQLTTFPSLKNVRFDRLMQDPPWPESSPV